jgi:hypothetical protein
LNELYFFHARMIARNTQSGGLLLVFEAILLAKTRHFNVHMLVSH